MKKPAKNREPGNDLDRWFAELEAIAAEGNQEDDARLHAAIQEIRQQEKELVRKKWELDRTRGL